MFLALAFLPLAFLPLAFLSLVLLSLVFLMGSLLFLRFRRDSPHFSRVIYKHNRNVLNLASF